MWKFPDFEGTVFKMDVITRAMKFTPIDSSRRELEIRFLIVSNGSELIILWCVGKKLAGVLFADFEGSVFKIRVFHRTMKRPPIDSSGREFQIRFLSVENGFELIVLRSDEVCVFFVASFDNTYMPEVTEEESTLTIDESVISFDVPM